VWGKDLYLYVRDIRDLVSGFELHVRRRQSCVIEAWDDSETERRKGLRRLFNAARVLMEDSPYKDVRQGSVNKFLPGARASVRPPLQLP
jgi:hypothetical protein